MLADAEMPFRTAVPLRVSPDAVTIEGTIAAECVLCLASWDTGDVFIYCLPNVDPVTNCGSRRATSADRETYDRWTITSDK